MAVYKESILRMMKLKSLKENICIERMPRNASFNLV